MKSLLYFLLFLIASQAYSQSLKLIHPFGGERFVVGDTIVIQWENADSTDLVQIEYSTNNGIDWNYIDTTRGHSYLWNKIPNLTSQDCLIKIQVISRIVNHCESTLFGSDNLITDINYNIDGSRLASADMCDINIWDVNNNQRIKKFNDNFLWVWSFKYSPDGKTMASSSSDRIIRLFDVDSQKVLQPLFIGDDQIYSIDYSKDGKYLAAGSYNSQIYILDIQTRQVVKSYKCPNGYATNIVFSSDGKKLLTSSSDNSILIWSFETDELLLSFKGHSDNITNIAADPNGNSIATCSRDKTVKIWNSTTGELISTFTEQDSVYSIAFTNDGRFLASASGNNVNIWEVETGIIRSSLQGHSKTVTCLTISPDNNFIASGSEDTTIKIWKYTVDSLDSDQSSSAFTIVSKTTGIKYQIEQNRILSIRQNPSDGKATIELNLIEDGVSTLKIYNSNGFLMDSYSFTSRGSRTIEVDTKNFNNGLYFITIETPTQFDKEKLMLVK